MSLTYRYVGSTSLFFPLDCLDFFLLVPHTTKNSHSSEVQPNQFSVYTAVSERYPLVVKNDENVVETFYKKCVASKAIMLSLLVNKRPRKCVFQQSLCCRWSEDDFTWLVVRVQFTPWWWVTVVMNVFCKIRYVQKKNVFSWSASPSPFRVHQCACVFTDSTSSSTSLCHVILCLRLPPDATAPIKFHIDSQFQNVPHESF